MSARVALLNPPQTSVACDQMIAEVQTKLVELEGQIARTVFPANEYHYKMGVAEGYRRALRDLETIYARHFRT